MVHCSVIHFNKNEISKLQTIENSVYRTILGAKRYTVTETIRGEVGTSLVETRLMKGKLTYVQGILKQRRNELVRHIIEEAKEDKTNKWMKDCKEYLKRISSNFSSMEEMKNT